MKIGPRALLLIVSGIGTLLYPGCASVVDEPPARSIEELVLRGDSDVFSVPFEHYREVNGDLPIGVFDSGIGGLTVLNEIVTIDQFNNNNELSTTISRASRLLSLYNNTTPLIRAGEAANNLKIK